MTPSTKTWEWAVAVLVLLYALGVIILWHILPVNPVMRRPSETVARKYYIGQVDEVRYDEAGAVVRSGPMSIRLLGVTDVPLGAQAFWQLDYGSMRFSWDGDTRVLHPWREKDIEPQ